MVTYSDAPFPVRQDIPRSHARFFAALARPGAWWTGAERVAIAEEVRQAGQCALCATRKAALSPYGIEGTHDAVTDLPANAIEAIHRITTDPGRLTRRWHASVVDDALTIDHYVELLGILVALVSIDSFCLAIGVPPRALPPPVAGEPSGYRPASAVMQDAWVPMIPADGNVGAEADLWQRGRTGNVVRAMSLVPDAVRTLCDLSDSHYLPMDAIADPSARTDHLDRQQIELLAGRISALNQCYY